MSLEQVKIRASDLVLGMYVCQLDRPWSSTPFPLQGFLLRQPKDIETLRSYCDYVFIDITKGRSALGEAPKVVAPKADSLEPLEKIVRPATSGLGEQKQKGPHEPKKIDIQRDFYADLVVPLSIEVRQAERTLKTLRGHFILASKQLAKGKDFDYEGLRKGVDEMVGSVLRCPDAFNWLMKLRIKDQYSHDHSLRAALWATQFARYIGLAKDEISVLTLGTLLKDVGKIQLPTSLVKATARTPNQEAEYRRFIDLGVEMLRMAQVEPRVISVVRHHCERNDGSGFPQGLYGAKIPFLARIAGIASFYDQLTSPRGGQSGLVPSKAISSLYNMRGEAFQDDLVVHFIQSVGIYPTGTLVEMTTGDIGVVVEQNPKSRLTPQLAVIPQQGREKYFLIDLKDDDRARKEMLKRGFERAANVSKMAIARDLELSGHQVDMEAVSRLFMSEAANQVAEAVSPDVPKGLMSKIKQKLLGGSA